jgi:enoyl-CoA hydratase
VGKCRALELILTGEPVTAQEAHRIGLVNQVVPAAELMAAAEKLANKIMANAPLAVKFALEAVNHGMEMPAEEGQLFEAALFGFCCATADMQEGTRAFLEKRPAKFTGH